jgi:hypothetical protein
VHAFKLRDRDHAIGFNCTCVRNSPRQCSIDAQADRDCFAAPQSNGVHSAELALLPRLPATAEELKSVALALQLDPAQVLHLGWAPNEAAVKSRDLTRYRIVEFAAHGLVPGKLDGLLRTCREL